MNSINIILIEVAIYTIIAIGVSIYSWKRTEQTYNRFIKGAFIPTKKTMTDKLITVSISGGLWGLFIILSTINLIKEL